MLYGLLSIVFLCSIELAAAYFAIELKKEMVNKQREVNHFRSTNFLRHRGKNPILQYCCDFISIKYNDIG
ncbi:hypothetical protein [Peribacillus glennii]|uniref:Uncharacterized protein n=1 Tax=Peribacillus glennii TaxID=2303991 RepID=A0A372LCX9_9BACI|nr:hypothetical protein [Peribacillus glennii]RFU63824.1 hypothetical protein D0466_10190 [Peribacillus glennii]